MASPYPHSLAGSVRAGPELGPSHRRERISTFQHAPLRSRWGSGRLRLRNLVVYGSACSLPNCDTRLGYDSAWPGCRRHRQGPLLLWRISIVGGGLLGRCLARETHLRSRQFPARGRRNRGPESFDGHTDSGCSTAPREQSRSAMQAAMTSDVSISFQGVFCPRSADSWQTGGSPRDGDEALCIRRNSQTYPL